MKKALVTAGAVLLTLCLVAPAEARRSKATQADRDGWSEETGTRSYEQRNFWEEDGDRAERRSHRSRAKARDSYETSYDNDNEERSSRRSRRHRSNDEESTSVASSGGYDAGPRPGAWCGWYMRTQRGGGPELNLAWNWSKWGSASGPQVGAVVVWPHHVGEIVGQAANGQWIVRSGNDSGRVRERPRSVAGAVFRVG